MRHRILWITFLTTLTFWLGCAGAGGQGERNYKMLEEDPPRFTPDRPSRGPSSPLGFLQSAAAAPAPPTTRPADVKAPPAAPAAAAVPTAPSTRPTANVLPLTAQPTPAVQIHFGQIDITGSGTRAAATAPAKTARPPATQPSLQGLDRSAWPRMTVTPDNGRTAHQPVYFQDLESWADRFPTPRDTQPTEEQLDMALGHSHARTLSLDNAGDAALQPFKFAFDLVTLPVQAVVEPPWKSVYTPPHHR